MDLRRRTEEKMRRLFVEAGGRPERTAPHYFVLGTCRWFRGLAEDVREVIVPLASLPSPVTSFTYPDRLGHRQRVRLDVDVAHPQTGQLPPAQTVHRSAAVGD